MVDAWVILDCKHTVTAENTGKIENQVTTEDDVGVKLDGNEIEEVNEYIIIRINHILGKQNQTAEIGRGITWLGLPWVDLTWLYKTQHQLILREKFKAALSFMWWPTTWKWQIE